jgi:hypothetical protein
MLGLSGQLKLMFFLSSLLISAAAVCQRAVSSAEKQKSAQPRLKRVSDILAWVGLAACIDFMVSAFDIQ